MAVATRIKTTPAVATMADRSNIEWCDSTFNPWIGCTKVSHACDHCYAEALMDARLGRARWGAGQPRTRTSKSTWSKPLAWNKDKFVECRGCGWRGVFPGESRCPKCGSDWYKAARRRVFCASLADVFDNEVDPQWRVDLFSLIARTHNLDWILLTKRIGNVLPALRAMRNAGDSEDNLSRSGEVLRDQFGHCIARDWVSGMAPKHVWIGTTISNREEMLRDARKLAEVPARVRFWSYEPALGALGSIPQGLMPDWIIAGGESGAGARPAHPNWFRELRDQCQATGTPLLFKQWGEWAPALAGMYFDPLIDGPQFRGRARGRDTHDFGDGYGAVRVGKNHAGRILDGQTQNEFPACA